MEDYDRITSVQYRELAQCYNDKNQAEKAEKYLKKAMGMSDYSLAAKTNLGIFYLNHNKKKKAEKLFKDVIKKDYNHAKSRLSLAYLSILRKDFQDALDHMKILRQREPGNPIVFAGLGMIYSGMGYPVKALKYYRRTASLEPKNAGIRFRLGMQLMEIGRRQKALYHLKEFVRLSPNEKDPRVERIKKLLERGK